MSVLAQIEELEKVISAQVGCLQYYFVWPIVESWPLDACLVFKFIEIQSFTICTMGGFGHITFDVHEHLGVVWKWKMRKENTYRNSSIWAVWIFYPSMNPVPYVFHLVFSCWHSWTLICFDHFRCNERDNNSGRIEELQHREDMLQKENMDSLKRPIWKSCQRLSHEKNHCTGC